MRASGGPVGRVSGVEDINDKANQAAPIDRWLLPALAAAEVVAEEAVTSRCEDGGMIVGQDDGICVSATLGAVAVSKEGVEERGPAAQLAEPPKERGRDQLAASAKRWQPMWIGRRSPDMG